MRTFILFMSCLLAVISARAQENLRRGKDYYKSAKTTKDQNGTTTWGREEAENKYKQALPYLQAAAKEGYGEACYYLGNMYCYGWGVGQDYAIAKRMYEKGLEFGYTEGEVELGLMYQCGNGCKADSLKAFQLYGKSAEHGSILGKYQLALCYWEGIGTERNPTEFVERCKLLEKEDYAYSDYKWIINEVYSALGLCYYKGLYGTEQNIEKAIQYFIGSLFPSALVEAAILIHDNDLKIPLNREGNYYQRSHYLSAAGLLRDAINSGKWFKGDFVYPYLDLFGGERLALACYYYVIWTMEENRFDFKYANLFDYLTRSAELDYGPAQKLLGDWYAKGNGTSINLLKAREWYDKAKANGEEVPE